MFFLVWIILFSILFGIVIFISYWENLIRMKNSYTREELIDFWEIYKTQINKMNPEFSISGFLTFFLGLLTAWILTLMGGFLSPDSGIEPDFASGELSNYFFQSFLFVGILHIIWPSLKEFFSEKNLPSFFEKILNNDKSYFTGLSVTLPSITLSCWGVYHKMSFMFFLVNAIIMLTYAAYQIQKESKWKEDNLNPEDFSNYQDNKKNTENELEI